MKIERVYRQILFAILDKRERPLFTQKALSKACSISISTVNYSLFPLEKINAIEKKRFGFKVINAKKILIYWASIRNLARDVVYQTFIQDDVKKIENLVPPNTIFTAYTAYKLKFKQVPSDYSEVIVYGNRNDFENRFGKETKDKKNLVVLKDDSHLMNFKIAPIAQIYVDLWNLGTWYADEFIKKLEKIIDGILE